MKLSRKKIARGQKRNDPRQQRKRMLNLPLRQANDVDDYRIRSVRGDDIFLLWFWANDRQTRKNSFNSNPIAWSTHEAWCAENFSAPNVRIWILEHQQVPVGQIRYERISAEVAEISFCVAPHFRHKGAGSRLLASTIYLAGRELGVNRVQGLTFLDNRASRGAFVNAKFQVVEEQVMGGRACLVFQRSCLLQTSQEAGVSL
jgi:RimJ/RimL family protein N-acetyltransferase